MFKISKKESAEYIGIACLIPDVNYDILLESAGIDEFENIMFVLDENEIGEIDEFYSWV